MQLFVPSGLDVLTGHFPGLPIVPGVVVLQWAIEFGRRELHVAGAFKRLTGVKFMRILPLQTPVDLTLRRSGDELFFEYRDAGRSCVQGRVLFGA